MTRVRLYFEIDFVEASIKFGAGTKVMYSKNVPIQIFTDGSSLGNPGPGGFCAIIKTKNKSGKEFIVKGGEARTTNNRMEMMAIIRALEEIHKKFPKEKVCEVFSDSNLIISTITKGWKRKKNQDLWVQLDTAAEKFEEIGWHWVRGHSNHPENTRADKIAVQEATKIKNNNFA